PSTVPEDEVGTLTDAITNQAAGPSRTMNVVLWVLQVLAAAMFAYAGLVKVSADPQQVEAFGQMGLGNTGMYVIGVLELAAALGLLLPGVVGFAGLCLVGLMIGAVIVTVMMMGPTPLVAAPGITLPVVAIVAWGRRATTARFIRVALGR